MFPKLHLLLRFRFLVSASNRHFTRSNSVFRITATYSTICPNQVESPNEEAIEHPRDSIKIFKQWGCCENDLLKIFSRQPSLRNAQATPLLSKLNLLSSLGLTGSDIVKMVNCRPRFFCSRINNCFDERIELLVNLFGSREMLRKALVRNPSLLTYDFHNTMKPVIALYEEIGISGNDLIAMLISRPTLIPRTSFNEEKMEYTKKTGVSKGSKMYKYVVSLIGISRIETIREKVTNLEKFGCSEEEIWSLLGRSPLILTLSVDKVQRNMTFVLGTMKLSPRVVLEHPFLLFSNLEAVLKPRISWARKLKEMEIDPQIKGSIMLTALRMTENRFLNVFIKCHPEDVANELLEFYKHAKGLKPLAESSKKILRKGFPF
ncbi:transcription termination factor MTERF9, chloroplastic-like [Gossypium arboreum]|uniref:transcription termination factor MTERF9, chloroplastic-like n=1 Tax=Gossypium arboreum TaxID=29729 RepID=UPI0008194037|nr:transcription termination factor MTERF9, chloroplastic-like [Gossypium arboreum]